MFRRDAGFATTMAETLCDRGVIAEPDTITALLQGAARRADVDAVLVASFLTNLLMPLTPDSPRNLEAALIDRCGTGTDMAEEFVHARSRWSLPASQGTGTDATSVADPSKVTTSSLAALPLTTILSQMRTHADPIVAADTAQRWSHSIEQFTGSAPRAVAVALLEHVERLQLGDLAVARAAGIASRAGAQDKARKRSAGSLLESPPTGGKPTGTAGAGLVCLRRPSAKAQTT